MRRGRASAHDAKPAEERHVDRHLVRVRGLGLGLGLGLERHVDRHLRAAEEAGTGEVREAGRWCGPRGSAVRAVVWVG